MPTNLPPEYFSAEQRYREASSPEEKITRLEELMGTIPKHKGTDKLRADLRRRLSKLKDSAQKSRKAGRHQSSFHIEREGAGRVVIIGMPNAGKSSLLARMTHATPPVSGAPFSTWNPTPGMLLWNNVPIQLIDTPPLNRDHMESELFDLIRSADLLLLILDLQADAFRQLHETRHILQEHGIPVQCEKSVDTEEITASQIPLLVAINKWDDPSYDEDLQVFLELAECDWPWIAVSVSTGRHLEQLPQVLFREMKLIRVFSKPPGKDPDLTTPFVLKQGSTVEQLAEKVHKDFLESLKSARVWGPGVFDGQYVGRDYVLRDGDVVELHT